MRDKRGFTVLELVVALMFGALLTSVAINSMGSVQGQFAVRSAEASFLSLHAQTRAFAVERGVQVQLVVNPQSSTATIRLGCGGGGEILQSRDFGEAYGVEITTGGGEASLCMTPKGVANPNLNSFNQELRVGFVRGGRGSAVVLMPLGQAVRP